MSPDASLVRRLIAFFKRPDALQHDRRALAHAQPAYAPVQPGETRGDAAAKRAASRSYVPSAPPFMTDEHTSSAGHASRLDALLLRCLGQFHAPMGFVVRYDETGRMHYLTGRDARGRFVSPADIAPDRGTLQRALRSGEPQLAVTPDRSTAAVCGPLWIGGNVVGALYLDRPARHRLHRGVFDLLCDQVARTLGQAVS